MPCFNMTAPARIACACPNYRSYAMILQHDDSRTHTMRMFQLQTLSHLDPSGALDPTGGPLRLWGLAVALALAPRPSPSPRQQKQQKLLNFTKIAKCHQI